MELFIEYALFAAKALTLVAAVLILWGGIAALSARQSGHGGRERLEVRHLNAHYDEMATRLQAAMLPRKALRHWRKSRQRKRNDERPRLFVLNFAGDMRASAVSALREEITALLSAARTGDQVVLRLESAGGQVHSYGLAASQLLRLKARQLPLTVVIDKVAASGGYLMACVADRIIAAPFAIVGSIGVIAQLPNFHRWLKKNEVDFEQLTAGEYKRTLTLFGENTDEDRQKMQADLEDIHTLFKEFVTEHRPILAIDQVATGEFWYGQRALEKQLVDELRTSDDYLLAASQDAELFEVTCKTRKPLAARLLQQAGQILESHNPLFK